MDIIYVRSLLIAVKIDIKAQLSEVGFFLSTFHLKSASCIINLNFFFLSAVLFFLSWNFIPLKVVSSEN
jgi:hypothetical protein